MKIIKRGVMPEDRQYKITCLNCHTIFEFKGYEGYIREASIYVPTRRICCYCPVCNTNCCTSV